VIKKVGIVVPTLGKRNEFLTQCLYSIAMAGDAFVCIVAPKEFDPSIFADRGLVDQVLIDPGNGLSAAINYGFANLPHEIEYINWIGDDDFLHRGAIKKCAVELDLNSDVVLVYGRCSYVNPIGKIIWINKSGILASKILRFGPDFIPQPGLLIRRKTFEVIGGLNETLKWAFDYDLLIRLKTKGKFKFVKEVLSSFRWHPESLSVEFRKESVNEASQVRISHLPKAFRILSKLWEFLLRKLTLFGGEIMNRKALKLVK
jgi:GT2 family glycosyltransferase